jgi:transcription antitermination protein NusB
VKERRQSRRLAVDILYEAEIRDRLPLEAFDERKLSGWVASSGEEGVKVEDPPSPEVVGYARALVAGVQSHQADIDETIAGYADRWAITRMPVIDRTLLRISLFELLWREDIPVAVAINEAVELAKELSTEDSGRFINGLLGRVVDDQEAAGSRDIPVRSDRLDDPT